jgi:hypothetical protein
LRAIQIGRRTVYKEFKEYKEYEEFKEFKEREPGARIQESGGQVRVG